MSVSFLYIKKGERVKIIFYRRKNRKNITSVSNSAYKRKHISCSIVKLNDEISIVDE